MIFCLTLLVKDSKDHKNGEETMSVLNKASMASFQKALKARQALGGMETYQAFKTGGTSGLGSKKLSSQSLDLADPTSGLDPSGGLFEKYSEYEGLTRSARGKNNTLVASNESMQEEIDRMISEGDGNTSYALTTGLDLNDLSRSLLGKKGSQTGEVASQSYYNDPINKEGFTRNAGGAPDADQLNAIEEIITVGRRLDATEEEIALALSFARHESGFNIYAAAKSSSAYGLGQFLDSTGSSYGLTEDNKDDLSMQAQALIEFTQYNVELSEKRGKGLEYVYKYHHDGPNKNSGGLAKSKKHIMPFYPKYLELVREST